MRSLSHSHSLFALLLLSVAVAACSTPPIVPIPGEGEGEGEGESAGEGEGEAFPCGNGGLVAPADACTQDADCDTARIQIDCCGTDAVTGVRSDQAEAFQSVADTCDAGYPRCRCAERAASADDGTIDDFNTTPTATCLRGRCVSSFGADDRVFVCADADDPVDTEASCDLASECALGELLVSCCGSRAVTGVRAEFVSTFQRDSDACFLEVCDCLSAPTLADDGTTQRAGEAATVDCIQGLCTSSFRG